MKEQQNFNPFDIFYDKFLNEKGEVVEKRLFLCSWILYIRSYLDSAKMRLFCSIGFWLIKDVGVNCSYCKKVIKPTGERIFQDNDIDVSDI